MKISLSWIKEYADISLSDDDLLMSIGAQIGEIEEVIDLAPKYKGIVIAEIVSAQPHPDADKLGVYEVNTGDKTVTVVAGDRSLQPGSKVAYIAPGLIVPSTYGTKSEITIEKRPLRGIESEGMLASASEVMVNDNHTEVLVLDSDKPVGSSFAEAYKLNDKIIDIETKTLTHRPDLFGMLGFAREVAAISGSTFTSPDWYQLSNQISYTSDKLPFTVVNDAEDLVPAYQMVSFAIEPGAKTPIQMQSYLSRLGVRPIRPAVDITNFMMLLSAQPSHAFDYDKIVKEGNGQEAKIVIRRARSGETLELLDGKQLELTDEDLIMAADDTVMDLAGCMGGANSEIDENTKAVILQSCSFDMYNIRRTSMRHGVFTDAVTCYARGQSPAQTVPVLSEELNLFKEVLGTKPENTQTFLAQSEPIQVSVSAVFINKLLGSNFSMDEMGDALGRAELGVGSSGDTLTVSVPFWRRDLHIEEDIAEEVGRIIGYDQLVSSKPLREVAAEKRRDIDVLNEKIRQILSAAGANEVLTYNFASEKLYEQTGLSPEDAYHIRNAISPELAYMRTAVMPHILEVVHGNIRQGYEEFGLFELGKSHTKQAVDKGLPIERNSIAFVYAATKGQGASYYRAKRFCDHLLAKLGELRVTYRSIHQASDWWTKHLAGLFEQKRAAVISIDGEEVGVLGEFTTSTAKNLKLPRASAGFELDLNKLLPIILANPTGYEPLSKYPHTEQDITFRTPDQVNYADIEQLLRAELAKPELLVDIIPIDIYLGENEENRAITMRVSMQHYQKTLTTKEVNKIVDEAVDTVNSKLQTKRA